MSDVPARSYVEGSILFPPEFVPAALETNQPGLERILDQERVWADEANALRERHETERSWVLYLLIGVPVALALLVLLARYRDRVPDVPKVLEQPPEDDPVQGSLLWSAWQGHLSPQNAYRAQVLKLASLGAIEMKADGRVTDPKDLTLVRKVDAMDLQTEVDQDFMWLLFGRGDDMVDEISVKHPKPRRADASGTYSAWWSGVKSKSSGITRRIQKGDARLESTLAAIIAIGAAGYGVWTAVWGLGGAIGWWLVPVSALSLIVALIKIHARLGIEDRRRVKRLEAFRTYLKDFSDLPNAPALAVIIWEQYLEWAVALDVADEVEKQVRALVPSRACGRRSAVPRAVWPGSPRGTTSRRRHPRSSSPRSRARAAGPRAAGSARPARSAASPVVASPAAVAGAAGGQAGVRDDRHGANGRWVSSGSCRRPRTSSPTGTSWGRCSAKVGWPASTVGSTDSSAVPWPSRCWLPRSTVTAPSSSGSGERPARRPGSATRTSSPSSTAGRTTAPTSS